MIAVVDYGRGNLGSVEKALDGLGMRAVVTQDPRVVGDAEAVVLPGDGAFHDAMGSLQSLGLLDPLRSALDDGRPFLGICLGKAFKETLGDKKGIVRYGASFLPMDEALLHAAVDISGRPYLVFNVPLQRTRIANFDLDLLKDFFRAFAFSAEITLHVTMHYGENLHHIAEAVFKAVGRALAEATRFNPRVADVPSTKGML